MVSGIVRDRVHFRVESRGHLRLGYPQSRNALRPHRKRLMQEPPYMHSIDHAEPTPTPKEPLLTRADLIAAVLVGIGIITITSVLLTLLF